MYASTEILQDPQFFLQKHRLHRRSLVVSDLCIMEFYIVSFGPKLTQACAFNNFAAFLSTPISSSGTPFGPLLQLLLWDYLTV